MKSLTPRSPPFSNLTRQRLRRSLESRPRNIRSPENRSSTHLGQVRTSSTPSAVKDLGSAFLGGCYNIKNFRARSNDEENINLLETRSSSQFPGSRGSHPRAVGMRPWPPWSPFGTLESWYRGHVCSHQNSMDSVFPLAKEKVCKKEKEGRRKEKERTSVGIPFDPTKYTRGLLSFH